MTVTSVRKDPEALTMTVTARFDAPVAQIWQLWENPRNLERWWGPPTYPATFVDFDLTPGGRVSYHMTGPEGDQPKGWWQVRVVDPPHVLEFEDGFADARGRPVDDLPTMVARVTLTEDDGGTLMSVETTFPSLEAMEQVLAMGAEEGFVAALGQIDDLLRAGVGTS